MMTWLATPCKHSKPVSSTNCPPAPNSYDGIDSMADGIRRMVFYMDTISPPGFNEWAAAQSGNIWCFPGDPAAPSMQSLYDKFVANNLGNASSNWETWRRRFYNSKKPKDSKTYYFKLGEWIALLSDLKTKLLKYTKQNSPLPVCEPGHYVDVAEDIAAPSYQCQYCQPGHPPPCLASPISGYGCPDTCGECSKSALPCRIARSQDKPIGGIIVEDEDGKGGNGEALVRAIKAINRLIKSMSDFRAEIPVWSDNMDAYLQELAAKDFEKDFGGYPTVTYRWTDSRGYNSVVVTVGDFIIPHIDDESRDTGWFSTDECIVLKDYADLYDNCWVRVTKYPPSKDLSTVTVSMGALGKFNPFNRGVTKKSYAEYNIDDKDSGAKNHVSLVDK
ncbi:MAG: hypothetical protein HZB36_03455 [Candidatus Omnitrophica bacterium]|nr:hypothetical protein [Candidatus Omnitrophota bacterium]